MIIGIDIDDTLSALYNFKLETATKHIKENNLNTKLVDDSAYLLKDMFDWDKESCNHFWWNIFIEKLIDAPMQESASKITHQLKKDGHTIIVITARSKDQHNDPYEESLQWLQKNNIYFDKLIVNGSDKGVLCIENNIDIFLDDHTPNILRIKEMGVEPVIFAARHNENFIDNSIKKVNSWQEFYNYINEIK